MIPYKKRLDAYLEDPLRNQVQENPLNYRVRDGRAYIDVMQIIGNLAYTDKQGLTPTAFSKELAKAENLPLTIRMDSIGGGVRAAETMANMLTERTKPTTVEVLGTMASSATYLAMAVGRQNVTMLPKATVMIHNARGSALFATAEELDDISAEVREKTANLVSDYVQYTGQSKDKIESLMKNETFVKAQEAVELGLAGSVKRPNPAMSNLGLYRSRYLLQLQSAEHSSTGT